MRIDVMKVLYNVAGAPLKDAQGKDLTLKETAVSALVNSAPNEQSNGEEKFKRWQLAQTIWNAKTEIDLGAEDIAKIKHLVGSLYAPSVVGPAFMALEGK